MQKKYVFEKDGTFKKVETDKYDFGWINFD